MFSEAMSIPRRSDGVPSGVERAAGWGEAGLWQKAAGLSGSLLPKRAGPTPPSDSAGREPVKIFNFF